MEELGEVLDQLETLIGKENAMKVMEFFAGEYIYFPKSVRISELHEQLYEELRNGATYSEMAVKYGYTQSYVRRIERKKYKERKKKKFDDSMDMDTDKTCGAEQEPPKRYGQKDLF
jgi:Mor family transcriptional regulator